MTFPLKPWLLAAICLLFPTSSVFADLISVTDVFNNWTREAGIINPPVDNSQWTLDQGDSVLAHYGNSGGTLMSDFDLTGDFLFSVDIQEPATMTPRDNDRFGMFIGTDPDNMIRLTWSGVYSGIEADNFVVEDLNRQGLVLAKEEAGSSDLIIAKTGINDQWSPGVEYRFELGRVDNRFIARLSRVSDGFQIIDITSDEFDTPFSFLDNPEDAIRLGVMVDSQDAWFRNFNVNTFDDPPPVPEPMSLMLLGMTGLSSCGVQRFRRRKKLSESSQ